MLSLQGVAKRYPTGLDALAGIDLAVDSGAIVAVVGASGCGKSTLLRLIAGLERATSGTLSVAGHPVDGPGEDVGVVFQEPRLMPWLTVEANIRFGLGRLPRAEAARLAAEAIARVGLAGFADAWPRQLSGGMAQRVALARALVNDPSLLILDEPLGKLDSLTRLTMQGELVDLWRRRGFSALLVTHDVEEALILASRVIVLSDRPARVLTEIVNDRPYPRHRGDPHLAALRHEALRLLGLDAGW